MIDQRTLGALEKALSRERYALTSLLDFARTLTPDLGVEGIIRSVMRTIMGKALVKDALAFEQTGAKTFRLLRRVGFRNLVYVPTEIDKFALSAWLESEFVHIPLQIPIDASDDSPGEFILAFGPSLISSDTLPDETVFLESLSRLASMAISNARLFESQRERERLESELRLAAEIQRALLPQTLPHIKAIELAGRSVPSELIGGDYYDALELDSHRVLLAIADVSGKGITGAMLMSNLQAGLHAYAPMVQAGQLTLLQMTRNLNKLVHESTASDRYITAVFAILDTSRMLIESVTCGHPNILILRADATVFEPATSGVPLGIFPDHDYQLRKDPLQPGDLVLLYTDGLSEAIVQSGGEVLGKDGIIRVVSMLGSKSFDVGAVLTQLTDRAHFRTHDDLTLLAASVGSRHASR